MPPCPVRVSPSHGSRQPQGAVPGRLTRALCWPISWPGRAASMWPASSLQPCLPSAPLALPGHQLSRFEAMGSRGRAWLMTGPAKGLCGPCLALSPLPLGAPQGPAICCASWPCRVSACLRGQAGLPEVVPPCLSPAPWRAAGGRLGVAPWPRAPVAAGFVSRP